MTNSILPAGIAILSLYASANAAPVKTVPWNGKAGAVSFTFDDNCASQVTNVLPSLKKRGITGTFFVTGGFSGALSTWKQAAMDGNELGNHTVSHPNLTTLSDSASIAKEIIDQAIALRAVDPSVEAVTLAYPNCATNALIDRITDRENIIARTCGGSAQFAWTSKPSNWMRATSFIVSDDASAEAALTSIDAAATSGSWLVTLNHGVGGDWLAITAAQADSMFDRAIARKTWIAPYQTVAAYWRASQVMDTVTAKATATGWSMSWVSPHPKMPRKVALRIRLDSAVFGTSVTVTQNGTAIAREADGSHVIDFMQKTLAITKVGSIGIGTMPKEGARSVRTWRDGNRLRIEGLPEGRWSWSLKNLSGRTVGQVNASESKDGRSAQFEIDAREGMLVVLGRSEGSMLAIPVPARF
jgi:peptidoglycan/xylan/chitin deacetylase (PgdA/CDA1 family)